MEKVLKILIVEDVATDAELICMELESASVLFEHKRVETKESFIQSLKSGNLDIILSDYSLPGFGALEALKLKNEININIPFILVTGNQTEEIAVECIKKGADDYILKSSLTRLPSALKNVIHKKEAELSNIKAIEETKASEEKYRNLFENSLVGMFRADLNKCVFTEANEKTKQILGINSVTEFHFKDCEFFKEKGPLAELLNGQKSSIENCEFQLAKSDNSKIWISLSAKLYKREGIIEGVINDITSTKISYDELEKANYELDRFAYHASHDLRSPLRSFEGLIEAALEEDSIDEIKSCLKMMHRSTIKMDSLINDLLTIAQNKKSEAKITSIDFSLEVNECLSQMAFMDNFKSIKISTQILQEFSFYSDAVRLRIILNNIISNAIKYHRLNQTTPHILINIIVSKDKANLAIEDNGTGIDEKHIAKVFDMFYRGTNESEGTGLGLYLVKMTIEKLEGKINVKSEKGKGTIFSIELPNMTSSELSPKKEESVIFR